ncbi:MAG: nucleotidyltransferase domain-containing protein, partial [Chitinispirillales bacterium]|nr:nucleotidyltransferase domain-containing protein [Chitinispirillales bacterium]
MDKEQALRIAEQYAEIVAKEFKPKQILFFGSYFDGEPHEYSDIDIAVIYDKYPGPGTWWDGATRLTSLCRKVDAS